MTADTFLHHKGSFVDNKINHNNFKTAQIKFCKTQMRNFSFVYYLIQMYNKRKIIGM